MKYNKIAFIGMMGSGKTTISRLLADKTGLDFFEADEIFVQNEKMAIKDFFKKFGENSFREKETEILKEISKKENFILSCGGGVVLKKENRDILFNNDIFTIYLETSYKTIFERIKEDTKRPLLQVLNPKEEIKKIIKEREEFYNLANLKIITDNKTKNEIVEEIFNLLWKK